MQGRARARSPGQQEPRQRRQIQLVLVDLLLETRDVGACDEGLRDAPSNLVRRIGELGAQSKEVALVGFGGRRELSGLNALTNGSAADPSVRDAALQRARDAGFKGA